MGETAAFALPFNAVCHHHDRITNQNGAVPFCDGQVRVVVIGSFYHTAGKHAGLFDPKTPPRSYVPAMPCVRGFPLRAVPRDAVHLSGTADTCPPR